MKKIIGTLCAFVALTFSLSAQINTNPAPISSVLSNAPSNPGTFFGTVQSYFTSFNPAYEQTFRKSNEVDIWAGTDSVQGAGMTASLGVSYNLWKSVSLESITRNGSIGGVIVSQQGGVGYSKVVHDVKVTAYLHGGYSFQDKATYGAIGARFVKALTENTYAGLGIEERIGGKKVSNTPTISVLTGFNF